MVVSRFAPSPTGDLHIGSVRTALYAWLFARQQNGKFILRIEDTDVERSTRASTDVILEGMSWLKLNYEIGPIFQSDRFQRYTEVAEQLLVTGFAYKCYCSKERIELLREEQLKNNEKPKYDGYCRMHNVVGKNEQDPFVIRFSTPQVGEVHYIDRIRGELKVNNSELDDLVIIRSDGTPTYNFAVVIDDLDMEVSMVIRGDDHINNTFRQINLFIALGAKPPQFAHVSAILGPDGKKLSKRHGATSVLAYRDQGILPHALINALVRLGWSHGDQEIFSLEEMINLFRIDDVHKSPAIFDSQKLMWFNQHYLKTLDTKEIIKELRYFLTPNSLARDQADLIINNAIDQSTTQDAEATPALDKLVDLFKPRVKTLLELAEKITVFYLDAVVYDQASVDKFFSKDTVYIFKKLIEACGKLHDSDWNSAAIHQLLNTLLSELSLKMPDLAQPIRIALLGTTNTPSIDQTMAVFPKQTVLDRLNKAIDYIRQK